MCFLDSLQFINSSLEKLVDALNKVYSNTKDETVFKHFNSGFPNISVDLKIYSDKRVYFPMIGLILILN